jgi:putative bacteriophage terminase
VRDQDLNLLAAYYGRIEPDELCKVIDRLMKLGYVGVLGIESNNTGIATIAKSKEYVWHSLLFKEKTVDKTTNRSTHKLGWNTNGKTRPLLLSDYKSLYTDGLIPNIDEYLRHEMYTFVYNAKKRPEASLGNHDDAVMSDAICCYMRDHVIVIPHGLEE